MSVGNFETVLYKNISAQLCTFTLVCVSVQDAGWELE